MKKTVFSIDMSDDGQEFDVVLRFPGDPDSDIVVDTANDFMSALKKALAYIEELKQEVEGEGVIIN